MKKQPEVTARTRQKLVDAFWELFETKRIEKISIGAITKKAGLNRGTFYEYYTDIYDLLEQQEQELLEQFGEYLRRQVGEMEYCSLTEFIGKNAKVFAEFDDRIFILLSNQGDPAFRVKLKERMREIVRTVVMTSEKGNVTEHKEAEEYVLTYIIGTLTSMVTYWYETGKKIPIEKLLEYIITLISEGALGFFDKTYEEAASDLLSIARKETTK
jgi:AcrR family transcriptional regulator